MDTQELVGEFEKSIGIVEQYRCFICGKVITRYDFEKPVITSFQEHLNKEKHEEGKGYYERRLKRYVKASELDNFYHIDLL